MAKPIKKQTWANIDVFGLLNGLSIWDEQYRSLKYVRAPFDNGLDLKRKIFATHDALPDVTKQGLLNGLSVEFDDSSYNVKDNSVFLLTYPPVPSGDIGIQDIFCYYKQPGETTWTTIGPQVWAEDYTSYKDSQIGFIVWQNDKYINISGYKNYRYSNLVEVLNTNLIDGTEFKFEYYVYVSDFENNRTLVRFTDMDNPENIEDERFKFKKAIKEPSMSGIVAYTLDDIPQNIKNIYYDQTTGMAQQYLYDLREYINTKFKHTWDKIIDRSSIWDNHIHYGSGHIPHFYDSIAPRNSDYCRVQYSGLTGGIEEMSYSLYPEQIIESGAAQNWYLTIYPGKFFLDGIPFYYFEKPQVSHITFVSGVASMPSGLQRGMYTILAKSGYYDDYCNYARDEHLQNVYEDYCYYNGPEGNYLWSNIYRRCPFLTSQMGHEVELDFGQYSINWASGQIYTILPSGYENAVLVWDNTLVPSGTSLLYDINPLNEENINLDKFFLYMSLDPTRSS